MSDDILQGPFPEITNHQVELIMPVGQPQQRAVYLRFEVLDENERSAIVQYALTHQRARRLAGEILTLLE